MPKRKVAMARVANFGACAKKRAKQENKENVSDRMPTVAKKKKIDRL